MTLELDLRKVQVYDTFQAAEAVLRPYEEVNKQKRREVRSKVFPSDTVEMSCFYELRTGNDLSLTVLMVGKYFARWGESFFYVPPGHPHNHTMFQEEAPILGDCGSGKIKKLAKQIQEHLANKEQGSHAVINSKSIKYNFKPFIYTVLEEISSTTEEEEIEMIKDLEKEMGAEEWKSMEHLVGQRGKKLFQAIASGEDKSVERGFNLEERTLFEKYFFT